MYVTSMKTRRASLWVTKAALLKQSQSQSHKNMSVALRNDGLLVDNRHIPGLSSKQLGSGIRRDLGVRACAKLALEAPNGWRSVGAQLPSSHRLGTSRAEALLTTMKPSQPKMPRPT